MGDPTKESETTPDAEALPARTKINPMLRKAQRAYVSTAQLQSVSKNAAPRTAPLMPPITAPSSDVPVPVNDPKIMELAVNPLAEVHKQIATVQKNAFGLWNGLVIYPMRRLAMAILWPVNKSVELVNLIMARIVGFFNRVLAMILRIAGVVRGGQVPEIAELDEPVHPDERALAAPKEVAPPPPPPKITYSEMLELNIIFTDNQNTPLYTLKQTRGTGRLGNLEEKMIAENAVLAIQECAVFTEEFPPPTTGPYSGQAIKGIMEQVANEDVQAFLRFVKAYPGKYVGKTWKISETFATWLLNNSPGP